MTSYRGRSTALLLCAFTLVTSPLTFGAISLQNVQSKITAKKAKWQAGTTSVSNLTDAEIKKMLGANLPDNTVIFSAPKKDNPFPFPFPFPWPDDDDDDDKDPSLPKSWDWRNHKGVSYSSPILDQGRCGSCVAFAVVGALETQMNISRNAPFSPWEFSPQHLFACGGGTCDRGWRPDYALDYLQSSGVPDEACFPYESGLVGKDLACKSSCSDSKARSEKIASYATEAMFFKSNAKLKKAVAKGPLVATMVVYEDFIYYKSGVYEHTTGKELGGHAVVIEGYDDAEGAFIVRNSWGPTWGDNGYFRIKYDDDSQIGANAYSIEVGNGDGFVTAKGVRDGAVLTGKVKLDLHSTYPGTTRISYDLLQGSVPVSQGYVATNSNTDLDTTTVPDGTYLLRTTAATKQGSEVGQDRRVHVLNGALTGSIQFTNIKDGDSVTGDKELELEVTSKPILPTELTFFFKEVKTGKVDSRATHNVGAEMNVGWRTDQKPKGEYEIWAEAKAANQSLTSAVLKVKIK